MILITILALLTALWIVATILWVAVKKKEFFDPRIYVLYGLFHWLIVGQLGTLLGYSFYEVKPFFDETAHAKAAILISCAVLFFLLGYSGYSLWMGRRSSTSQCSRVQRRGEISGKVAVWHLSWLACAMGALGLGAGFFYQGDIALVKEQRFLPLLLTYLAVPASICAIYILFFEREKLQGLHGKLMKFVLLAIALSGVLLSNVNFIFPLLFAIYSWYHARQKLRVRIKEREAFMYAMLIFFVGLWSIIFKISQEYIAQGEWPGMELLMAEALYRWKTLDLFNPESYGIMLHSFQIYPDSGNLLAGKSLLVTFPFLRLASEDIRGFGRIIVIDVYGLSYLDVNVGWAVPPIAELAANFGYLSIPFFYFFLGMTCRYLYAHYRRSRTIAYWAFYGVVLPWLFLQQRGDFLNGNVYAFYIALWVILSFSICKHRPKPDRLGL